MSTAVIVSFLVSLYLLAKRYGGDKTPTDSCCGQEYLASLSRFLPVEGW
jgi:hypothetical protein